MPKGKGYRIRAEMGRNTVITYDVNVDSKEKALRKFRKDYPRAGIKSIRKL